MKEEIISFETAKLAKKKGFDKVWCNNMYCIGFNSLEEDKEIIECDWRNNVGGQFHLALAPTQSLLQRWLRKKHEIHIYPECMDSNLKYNYICNILEGGVLAKTDEYDTYEQALEVGLLEGLKLIK